MFNWLKSKIKKRLSIEADKAIFQCENFIPFTWDMIGEAYEDPAFIEIQNELIGLNQRLDKIKQKRNEDGTFAHNDADDLMKLNKDCRRVYSKFRVNKSFDEEFKFIEEKIDIEENPYPIKKKEDFLSEKPLAKAIEQAAEKVLKKQEKDKPLSKQEMEEAIRMGTKLADLGTLHNLESRTKASLEKNINQNDSEKTIELDQGSFLNKKNFTKEAYVEQWKKWTNDIKMLCNTSEDYQKLKDLEIWVDGLASKSFDNMYQEQQNKLNEEWGTKKKPEM